MTILLIAILAAILTVLVIAAGQSGKFRTSRSILIAAPASAIFPEVNELQRWQTWSPWVKLDPNAVYSFEGPPAGVGASTSWVGTKTGEGTSTITESIPNERIEFRLDFKKPMKSTSNAEFTFINSGELTSVTWSMYGKSNFMGKLFAVFVNCDKMVGIQFEQGLADLKAVVEKK